MESGTCSGNTDPGVTNDGEQRYQHARGRSQQLEEHLQLDELSESESWDDDSALGGMSGLSSTQSVTSSIYDYVVENGRTYHRFREGKYLLPNDETEQKRLNFEHSLYTAILDGKHYISPVDHLKNILDVGTGTGVWAIEMGLENPGAHVIGTDLSPIQSDYTPPNVTFEICDAEDEWSFQQSFDLIHMRSMVTSFKDQRAVFAEAYRSLAPGGYLEVRDPIFPFNYFTPPPEGCVLQKWADSIIEAARLGGHDWGAALHYGEMLSGLGFINVTERREAIALNPWVKGAHNKQLSLLLQHDILNLLEPLSMALFTRILGWEASAVLDYLELVRKDVQDTKIHSYSEGIHIYAQKPYDAE